MLPRTSAFFTALSFLACSFPCWGLTIAPGKLNASNAVIEKIVASDYNGALTVCESLIRDDSADPLGPMLKLAAIGLHDLDLDSASQALDFYGAFVKCMGVVDGYERVHGVSSYSLTARGFARATAAAYDLWRKKYFAGLDLGFDALAKLQEAKKLDATNRDVDFFLGLYTYARAEMKKTFWWAFFWYPGDKNEGIKKLAGCSVSSQFCRRAATLVLGEVLYRENRFAESDSISAGLQKLYPQSRLVRWTSAKRAEAAQSWAVAAENYQLLADAYDSIPEARRNSFLTRNKAAHMYFFAGNSTRAIRECQSILNRPCSPGDAVCRQLVDDARKLKSKISGAP
jgi:tetratricopeptide (TPR) repeat protein